MRGGMAMFIRNDCVVLKTVGNLFFQVAVIQLVDGGMLIIVNVYIPPA